jgi:PAS domain S-box-containing protein
MPVSTPDDVGDSGELRDADARGHGADGNQPWSEGTDGAEWRELVGALPHIVWIARPDGVPVYFNQQWMDFTGLPLEESLGDGWLEPFHPDERSLASQRWAKAIETGNSYEVEHRLRHRDGEYDWMLGRALPLRDGSGEIVSWFGTCTDIQDLKAALDEAVQLRTELEDRARRLTTTFESISDGFFAVDPDWRFTYVNRRAEEILGRDRASLIGEVLWEAFPNTVGSVIEDAFLRAKSTDRSEFIEAVYAPVLGAWLSIHAYPSENGLAAYVRDVSEARRNQDQLARQAHLLDEASDAILVRDLDHRVTYWNRSAERIYGYRAHEVLGRSIRELLYRDADTFERATQILLANGEWSGALVHFAKDGSELTVDGRWTLLRDDEGQPESVLCLNSDVTDRRRIEQQLLRAQRLDSLGTLAGGIAHDLNNVLAPIMLAAASLQRSDADAETSEMLEIIERSAARGADMVRQVTAFARGVDGEQREELDLDDLLDDVVRIVRSTFPKNIHVHRDATGDVWPTRGDATQLHQVLMNLCINARDAMPDGGALRLRVDNLVVDDRYVTHVQQVTPGRYVRIRVADDGTGIDRATLDRLFEPFFTTKAQGEGTGLGLPVSRGIVLGHGGYLDVDSELGVGTTFDVYLPAADALDAASGPPDDQTDPPGGNGELVLIVDDEAALRAVTRRILESAGYQVIEARNGTEAIELFARRATDVDAIIIDMMMPSPDGPATLHALFEHRPHIPVIAMSGHMASSEVAKAADLGVELFLAKPFTAARLLTTLHGVLRQ